MTIRERIAAAFSILTALASGGFIAAYFTGGHRFYEGVTLFVACAGFVAVFLAWAFWFIPHEQVVDEIHDYPSPQSDRSFESENVSTGLATLTRHKAVVRSLYVALGMFGLALIAPIRSLGPDPDKTLFHTKWRKGSRVARSDGSIVHVNDVNVGAMEAVFPENAIGDAMSQANLVRVPPGLMQSVGGNVVFSRICTHAGCPVALYRSSVHELICPCHQSVFNLARDCAVVSGPAARPLPQLPIAVADDGTLVATGDFPVPVGPGFWERP